MSIKADPNKCQTGLDSIRHKVDAMGEAHNLLKSYDGGRDIARYHETLYSDIDVRENRVQG